MDSGLEAQSTTSAPPSRSVIARLAVSAVTCRQAEMRMPFSGWLLMKSLRMICRTFIDWLAQSMRFLPMIGKVEVGDIAGDACGCGRHNLLVVERAFRPASGSQFSKAAGLSPQHVTGHRECVAG